MDLVACSPLVGSLCSQQPWLPLGASAPRLHLTCRSRGSDSPRRNNQLLPSSGLWTGTEILSGLALVHGVLVGIPAGQQTKAAFDLSFLPAEQGGPGCHLPSHLCLPPSLCFLADFSSFEMRPHPVPGARPPARRGRKQAGLGLW